MKFFRVLLFFFLLFIVGVTTYWISQDFVHKNRDVVILGDSHVNLIETITDSTWQQLLVDVDVIGLGFNGYTSSQLLSGEYSPLRRAIEYRPKHVIVVIGANDVGNEVDPDLTLRNIAAIHEAFSNTSSQVYFT
jgi:lysophospholipase L1-like esterase